MLTQKKRSHFTLFATVGILLSALTIAPRCFAAGDNEPSDEASPGLDHISFYQKYISDLRYGHCGFRPSCSQFAAVAIEEHGFIQGSALAADRLIRCHPGAYRYYERGPSGRLDDPVDGDYGSLTEPHVPPWLLPDIGDLPLPLDRADESLWDRLIEYTAFADALAKEGDCYRAGTEYKRVAFLAQDPGVEGWSRFKTGSCYFNTGHWGDAASQYLQAAWWSRATDARNVAYFMTASSRFNAGAYTQCRSDLDRCIFEGGPGSQQDERNERAGISDTASHYSWMKPQLTVDLAQTHLLTGMCLMADGQWESASERFDDVARIHPVSGYQSKAVFLSQQSAAGSGLSSRNPTLAAVMSAVIPGSGQMYAGRAFDGLRHLLFNGILIYSVVYLIREEHYAGGYLLAAFTLPFYVGNIAGAKKSADHYNASKRRDYLATSINEAGKR